MSWIFRQRSGELLRPDGTRLGMAYSGFGPGVNNPEKQEIHDIGPIPQGKWRIGTGFDHPRLGPLALPLLPQPGTQTFGRTGFFIHGDTAKHVESGNPYDSASHGCIVIGPRTVREIISCSQDRELIVEEGNGEEQS